ncbi:MAG: FkbM family methyltransferase [Methylophilaceae bacterium]|nr:FkbM family methyltransferase [Methylophilaceae bacterium]
MATDRPIAFILVSSDHGTMIVNRNDYRMVDSNRAYGVGYDILQTGCFSPDEIELGRNMLKLLRSYRGEGLMVVDCGANIGTHTVEWAKTMTGWGKVIAFEAQEYVFYSLAGNIAINNCFNATAHHVAVGKECGEIAIPVADYLKPANFGGLELKQVTEEFIGQPINYSKSALKPMRLWSIDSLSLPRLDFLKMDVEGMEEEVLFGAQETIKNYKPIMLIEVFKSNQNSIRNTLKSWGYTHYYPVGMNILTLHENDPCLKHINVNSPPPTVPV